MLGSNDLLTNMPDYVGSPATPSSGGKFFQQPQQDIYRYGSMLRSWDWNGDGITDMAGWLGSYDMFITMGDDLEQFVDDDGVSLCQLYYPNNYGARLKDFNGDGYGDLVHGNTRGYYVYDDPINGPTNLYEGTVRIYAGGAGSITDCEDTLLTIFGEWGDFGYKPVDAGDLNDDGKSELAVSYKGTDHFDNSTSYAQCTTLWYGGASGTLLNSNADTYFKSTWTTSSTYRCGDTLYGQPYRNLYKTGDVSGDDIDDLLYVDLQYASAYGFSGFLFYGGSNTP